MYQARLPLIPEGASRINEFVSVCRTEKSWTYFSYDQPVYRHDPGDRTGFYLTACQMLDAGVCRECEILEVFGVPKRTLDNWQDKYRKGGISSFFRRPVRKKKSTVLTPEVLEQAQHLHHILLLLGLMALCRIKTVEKLSWESSGEMGILLGLDRAPEVHCLRRKMDELAGEDNA